MDMTKLEQGAELFKQFVIDEHNELYNSYLNQLSLKEAKEKQFFNLQKKHQDLTELSLKQTAEIERLKKHSFGEAKIALLEQQIMAMSASHSDLVRKNISIAAANEDLINKNAQLRSDKNILIKDNMNLNTKNIERKAICEALIKFIDSLGYSLEVLPLPKPSNMGIEKEKKYLNYLKSLVELKYQVEEVKPTEKPEPKNEGGKFSPEFLKDLLLKGLGKDFHVEVIGGDEKSQQAMKNLFGEIFNEKKSGRNENRDEKGKFASPKN